MSLSVFKGAFILLMVSLLSIPAQPVLGQDALPDQKVVPEKITGELVLTGQHLMEKSVTVSKEGVLILEAGARLQAASDTALTVQGTLRVNGSEINRLRFIQLTGPGGRGSRC